jgi:hypothetical protein
MGIPNSGISPALQPHFSGAATPAVYAAPRNKKEGSIASSSKDSEADLMLLKTAPLLNGADFEAWIRIYRKYGASTVRNLGVDRLAAHVASILGIYYSVSMIE